MLGHVGQGLLDHPVDHGLAVQAEQPVRGSPRSGSRYQRRCSRTTGGRARAASRPPSSRMGGLSSLIIWRRLRISSLNSVRARLTRSRAPSLSSRSILKRQRSSTRPSAARRWMGPSWRLAAIRARSSSATRTVRSRSWRRRHCESTRLRLAWARRANAHLHELLQSIGVDAGHGFDRRRQPRHLLGHLHRARRSSWIGGRREVRRPAPASSGRAAALSSASSVAGSRSCSPAARASRTLARPGRALCARVPATRCNCAARVGGA